MIKKKWNDEAILVLTAFSQVIKQLTSITAETAKAALESVTTSLGIGAGKILQALRVSITGQASGPDLMITMEILGGTEVANRIDHALNTLKKTA